MALCLSVWSGCDAAGMQEQAQQALNYQGLTYRAVGNAVLTRGPEGMLRVVSSAPRSGVLIETKGYHQGNLFFRPVAIEEGGAFSMALVSTGGKPLARVLQYRPVGGKEYHLAVDLSGLGAESFTLELRDGDEVVFRRENIRLASDTTVVGTTDEEPTSYHYIEDEGGIIVEVDYEDETQAQIQKASVTPAIGETGPFQVTHVAFIPEGQGPSSSQVTGMRLTGVPEIAIVKERFR